MHRVAFLLARRYRVDVEHDRQRLRSGAESRGVAMKGDQLVALVTYEVSADGKTLTSRSSGTIEMVIVYERR